MKNLDEILYGEKIDQWDKIVEESKEFEGEAKKKYPLVAKRIKQGKVATILLMASTLSIGVLGLIRGGGLREAGMMIGATVLWVVTMCIWLDSEEKLEGVVKIMYIKRRKEEEPGHIALMGDDIARLMKAKGIRSEVDSSVRIEELEGRGILK